MDSRRAQSRPRYLPRPSLCPPAEHFIQNWQRSAQSAQDQFAKTCHHALNQAPFYPRFTCGVMWTHVGAFFDATWAGALCSPLHVLSSCWLHLSHHAEEYHLAHAMLAFLEVRARCAHACYSSTCSPYKFPEPVPPAWKRKFLIFSLLQISKVSHEFTVAGNLNSSY